MDQTEAEFIAAESAKHTARLRKMLLQIDRKGCAGRQIIDLLSVNGLIEVCGPRPEINRPYNSFRLTSAGRDELIRTAA